MHLTQPYESANCRVTDIKWLDQPSSMARWRSSGAREAHGFSPALDCTWVLDYLSNDCEVLEVIRPLISRRWNSMSRRCRFAGKK